MSKHEQEAKIEKLKALNAQFEGAGSGGSAASSPSGNVMPSKLNSSPFKPPSCT